MVLILHSSLPLPLPLPLPAIIETLEADVRSKFQTKRRIEDCHRGVVVEVPFDVTTVSFLWRQERVLEVTDIALFKA
jgi:hypothetical protein